MSTLILTKDGTPFKSVVAAKSARTKMGEDGQSTNVIEIEGGFALETKTKERRGKRVPVGTRQKLMVDKRELDLGYEHRFVNNKPGRIEMFEEGGWEIVKGKKKIGDPGIGEGTQMGSAVTKDVGQGTTGVLMRIKKEWYKEDQDAKSDKIKESMKTITKEAEKPGNYGKIEIKTARK